MRLVLVEREGLGRTEQFTQVEFSGEEPGTLVKLSVSGHTGRHLLADRVSKAA